MIKDGIVISQKELEIILKLIGYKDRSDLEKLTPEQIRFLSELMSLAREDDMENHIEQYHSDMA